MRAKETGTGVVLAGLRTYRELRLLTQGELAALAVVSRATIGDAEQGERISIRNARKIASALGIEAAQLLQQPAQEQGALAGAGASNG